MTSLRQEWDASYLRRENHVFVAADEVARFVSRYLRRRVGLDEVIDVDGPAAGARVLDLGCGIGRHLVYGADMGLTMYGIDLSPVAVETAVRWLATRNGPAAADRLAVGDAGSLPWADGFFAHALSDSALDSMPFVVAQAAVGELVRVVTPGGLIYLSLIDAGTGGVREEVVETVHEANTIQSYFDRDRIDELLGSGLETAQRLLVQTVDDLTGRVAGRWHVVARRK